MNSTTLLIVHPYKSDKSLLIMKCHVPGPNVRVLGRTVHALARFGDELYLESLSDCILLRTLNAAESAYAMVKFNKNFFTYFNHNYYATEDNDGIKCKISMKSALHTFKSPTHMDKQVENLEIKLEPELCKLIFQLKCKHGIVKTHFVSILECKSMQAVYTKDMVPNRITSSQKILSEALGNFTSSDDQVTFEVSDQSLTLRNYIDNTDSFKITRTKITIRATEFDSYIIGSETIVTFTLKEFRALLAYAEALNLPVQIHFETTGQPMVFIIHNGSTFEAHFVMATSKPDNATQVTTTQNTTNIERKRKENSKVTDEPTKKPHFETDMSVNLDEDSHLFNFIEIPGETNNCNGFQKNENYEQENVHMDCDNIPASPASLMKIKSVFKRCFESTFDPRSIHQTVLAENSDSD